MFTSILKFFQRQRNIYIIKAAGLLMQFIVSEHYTVKQKKKTSQTQK